MIEIQNLTGVQPAIPPVLYAEIVLCFDHDFPVQALEERLKLKATESKMWSEMRINPITKTRNPGFWEYKTAQVASFDAEDLLRNVHDLLWSHRREFQQAIQEYSPTDVILKIYITVRQEDEFPAIRLPRYLLEDISMLNGYVDIVIDNDYSLIE